MEHPQTSGFPAKKDKAAALLASGLTMRAVAKKLGVNERTIHTWRADPEFLKLVTDYQSKMIARSLGRLSNAASKAVQTLIDCLKSNESDSVKVRAAMGILDQLVKMRELTNHEQRLTELERRIACR
jgi:hypothetical protein